MQRVASSMIILPIEIQASILLINMKLLNIRGDTTSAAYLLENNQDLISKLAPSQKAKLCKEKSSKLLSCYDPHRNQIRANKSLEHFRIDLGGIRLGLINSGFSIHNRIVGFRRPGETLRICCSFINIWELYSALRWLE